MTRTLQWLPPIILFADYGGDWASYIEAVHAVFRQDFISSRPQFESLPVVCNTTPEDGREAAFWHIVQSECQSAGGRLPDLRRCERIPWPRPAIEHTGEPAVSIWTTVRRRKGGAPEERVLIWIECVDYLVVLARKKTVMVLVTAYCTDAEHRRRKLREEREECRQNAKTAPKDGLRTPSTRGG